MSHDVLFFSLQVQLLPEGSFHTQENDPAVTVYFFFFLLHLDITNNVFCSAVLSLVIFPHHMSKDSQLMTFNVLHLHVTRRPSSSVCLELSNPGVF